MGTNAMPFKQRYMNVCWVILGQYLILRYWAYVSPVACSIYPAWSRAVSTAARGRYVSNTQAAIPK